MGFDAGPAVTPWVPVWVGDATLCQQWLDGLAEASIAARAWLAPGTARLLLSLSATTTDAQLTQLLEVFDRLARPMKPRELSKEFPGAAGCGATGQLHPVAPLLAALADPGADERCTACTPLSRNALAGARLRRGREPDLAGERGVEQVDSTRD